MRETTKYIETALVIDKAMFERRNGSTRSEVVHDAIQVANIADLVSYKYIYFSSLTVILGSLQDLQCTLAQIEDNLVPL